MATRLNALRRSTGPVTARISRVSPHSSTSIRNMASSAPRTYEWLVVVPDKPGMQETRLKIRPDHFKNMTKFVESGQWKMGGAILEDMPADDEVSSMNFAGSTLVIVAESKEAALATIKDDVYVKHGVWDMEKVMIWPAKIAFRNP